MFDVGTAASEANAATALSVGNGRWAAHVGGSGKRNGDVRTPEGEVENTQSRGGFGNAGVSFTGQKGYVGASYGYDNTRYGIPFVEEGQVELTPRRHVVRREGGSVEARRARSKAFAPTSPRGGISTTRSSAARSARISKTTPTS